MKTFFNKNFTKRNYDCTNVVACIANEAPNDNFQEMTAAEIHDKGIGNLQKLYIENGVQYYGFL